MKYPFIVFKTQVEDHQFWIAKSQVLKGCVGQGETADEACKELGDNEIAWLETAREYDIDIPEIPVEIPQEYSGKISLRMSPYVHKTASEYAKQQNISLNQYINEAIVAKNTLHSSVNYIGPELINLVDNIKRSVFEAESVQSQTYEGIYAVSFMPLTSNNSQYKI